MKWWLCVLLFGAILAVLTHPVLAGGDDDDDEDGDDKPASNSHSGGECEWVVPGTSRVYDLSGMVRFGTNAEDDWKAEEDIQGFKFDYYFNICKDSIKGCNNHKTSASQYQIFGGTSAGCIPLGEAWSDNGAKNVEWSEFGNPGSDPKSGGVIIKYKNGQVCSTGGEKFSISIKIPCGDNQRKPGKANDGLDPKKFVVEQDSTSGCQYTITFPPIQDGCPGSGRGGDWGWMFIGCFILVMTVYFGAGILFRMKKLGYSGRDAIPHLEFWENLPGLVMDGIRFTIDRLKALSENIQSRRS